MKIIGTSIAATSAPMANVEITGDKIATILKAASVEVEPFWPSLFAGALKVSSQNFL